ncbi:MAG: TetR/AcrR family transcriptional regulator [Hyphomonadaceae bacterium]|nr:TetR/AcrR family transcriptional regulator [Hyphomonadaceae bacterium]
MAQDTRERLLDQAESLFAERGFYGVSIAAIANELGLTKQALLHHFGSKEKLYGEVLKRISEQFAALEQDRSTEDANSVEKLVSYMLELLAPAIPNRDATRVLMRELLDNKRRADTASTWYLKSFLERLIALVKAIPGWQSARDAEALALVYQWLGAINYYNISEPTLTGIFGASAYRDLDAVFGRQLEKLIRASLIRD